MFQELDNIISGDNTSRNIAGSSHFGRLGDSREEVAEATMKIMGVKEVWEEDSSMVNL